MLTDIEIAQKCEKKKITQIALDNGISEDYLRSKLEEAENRLGMPLYPKLRPSPPKKEIRLVAPLSPKQFGIKRNR